MSLLRALQADKPHEVSKSWTLVAALDGCYLGLLGQYEFNLISNLLHKPKPHGEEKGSHSSAKIQGSPATAADHAYDVS